MKSAQLLEGLEFNSANPHASAVYVDKQGRAIVWTLEPYQSIEEHRVPQSPLYVVVLQGHGWFAGADNKEEWVKPGSLLILDPGERHQVRAAEDRLVFVGILHGAPGNLSDKVGGEIGRAAN